MYAAVGSASVFTQRIKVLALSGLLALSLVVGASATTVGAAAPQIGQDSTQASVPTVVVAAKPTRPGGTKTTKPGLHTYEFCTFVDNAADWEALTGMKADPDFVGGFVCYKWTA